MDSASRKLFPAVRAGLHCGRLTRVEVTGGARLFPAVRAGLHCGGEIDWVIPDMLAPLPGREGRAPLRLVLTPVSF